MDDQHDPDTRASARTPEQTADMSATEPDKSAPAATNAKKAKKAKKKRSFGRELLTIVVAAAVLTLLVKAFVVQ
ncbi:MAG: hypothetical protein ACREOE_19690, partial [Gemmatimonadales bacterium]